MNKRIVRVALTSVVAGILVAGCFAASPQVAYYSLYAPAQRPVVASAPTDGILAVSVGPVVIPDILKQAQIATGGADGRYRLAEYHRWSGELDRDLARAVAEQLAGNLGIEKVSVFPWDQNFIPNCRVGIDVLSMGGEPGREATLEVRWTLIDPQGKKPQIVRRSELKEAPAEPGYPAWIAAQQRNIVKLAQEIAGAIQLSVNP
ncbi:MAG: PqiC family protein [Desulfuromonadales bacterium]|nr:PqiC family protein [Desulfuromonadales bacterium]